MEEKHKIIIDTDPGIDDAMAIHYAFADPRIKVLGLTSVFGNVYTEQATRNALFLAEQANYKLDVAEGAKKPIKQNLNQPSFHVHGEEGFGSLSAQTSKKVKLNQKAKNFISQTCRKYPGEVVVCPIGPLTNIAEVLKSDPEITKYVKKIIIMGGALKCKGNVTEHAEANIWNDPHAADIVFGGDWKIEIIGLDVTRKIISTRRDFQILKKNSPEIGGFINKISDFYINFYESVTGEKKCLMHDPSAIVALTDPSLFKFEEHPLEVICEGEIIGKTIISKNSQKRHPIKVALNANFKKVSFKFFEICANADRESLKRKTSIVKK